MNRTDPSQALVTALTACRESDPEALDRLATLLYPELRRIARAQLRRLRPGQTLSTTGLVHETYLKLAGGSDFVDRSHFLAASARAMRHILVNAARRKHAGKRGGGRPDEMFDDELVAAERQHLEEVIGVAEALDGLRDIDERLCSVVECRFYAGMTEEETGTALGVSSRTVRRDWLRARAWLKSRLATPPRLSPSSA